MADQRTYAAGRFALNIDGTNVAFVKKFDGLSMEADVVANDLGPDNFQSKHVSNIKWTAGKATVGIAMGAALYKWIKVSFDKAQVPKNGSLQAADFNYKCQSELTFQNAIITSVGFPKLDGSSKDAVYLDIEFEPEQVRWNKGDGSDIRGQYGVKQKAHLCSNFRFEMGSLPCSRVATVDAFTWKCAVAADQIGIFREPTKHAAKVTVPEIKISVSMADFPQWEGPLKSWFVDGNHLAKDEMQGSIVLLGPNMKDEIARIELKNCGFKKFSKQTLEANSEKIARFDVEFYVEGIALEIKEYDA